MYDVVYLDDHARRVLAAGLAREGAVTLARSEARRLRIGGGCSAAPTPRRHRRRS